MRAVFGGSLAGARNIDGHVLRETPSGREVEQKQPSGTGKSVRPVTRTNGDRISFGDLARFAWPTKTEFHLAHTTRVDPRTCRRWLAGNNEPPAEALGVVLAEIMRRFHQRE